MSTSKFFTGFSPESILFLQGLKENNNKVWFEAHKEDYKKFLVEPLKALASDLADTMLTIDPYVIVHPNKAISRIYRDTRFSHNKNPYKTGMWITFKRTKKDWQDDPVYFFEIFDGGYRYGMGMYQAMPETMRKFRERVKEHEQEFLALLDLYKKQKTFELGGEMYKKIFDKNQSSEIQNWYQRKTIYFMWERSVDDKLFQENLREKLIKDFVLLAPFYRYFQSLKDF